MAVDGAGASPIIDDCTFVDNETTEGGGGLYVSYGASATVINSYFHDNSADDGGGLLCQESSPTISNVVFRANQADYGGGVAVGGAGSSPSITGCTFVDNEANGDGGGLHVFGGASATVVSSGFHGNRAYLGGGVNTYGSGPVTLTNCTIAHNQGQLGAGLALWGGSANLQNSIIAFNPWGEAVAILSGDASLSHCDLYGNPGGDWTGAIAGQYGTDGNISADPLFVTGPDGNHYLSQTISGQASDSPCVDAGDPGSETITGTTRTDHFQDSGVVDMGHHYRHHLAAVVGSVSGLRMDRSGPGVFPPRIELSWSASCGSLAQDYGIYEGRIGDWDSHTWVDCEDDGDDLTEQVGIVSGDRYYLVVPLGVSREGSYGRDSTSEERPPGTGVCRAAQNATPCN